MKQSDTISAKEIRQDLDGFLRRLKTGKPLTVIYRSKPMVTIVDADKVNNSDVQTTQQAIKESLGVAKLLRGSGKADNRMYHQLLDEEYGQ